MLLAGNFLTSKSKFSAYGSNRMGHNNGCVIIAVSEQLVSYDANLSSPLEHNCTCVQMNNKAVVLCDCCRPTDAKTAFRDDLHDCPNQFCHYVTESSNFSSLGLQLSCYLTQQ